MKNIKHNYKDLTKHQSNMSDIEIILDEIDWREKSRRLQARRWHKIRHHEFVA